MNNFIFNHVGQPFRVAIFISSFRTAIIRALQDNENIYAITLFLILNFLQICLFSKYFMEKIMNKRWIFKILFFVFIFQIKSFAELAPPNPKVYDVFGSSSVYSEQFKSSAPRLKIPHMPSYKKSSIKRSMANTGVVKPLIILIQFLGTSHDSSHTTTYFNDLCFNGVLHDSKSVSLKDYYDENSGGKLIISSSTVSNPSQWLTSSHTMAYYGADGIGGIDDKNDDIYELAREAVQKLAASSFDFREFDRDGDKIIDCVIIVHAGEGQENSSNSNDIWSHNYYIPGGEVVTSSGGGTYTILEYSMVSENSPIGIWAHEVAHSLSPSSSSPGLPDLYNTSDGSNVVGSWCLMDAGCWLNDGWTPSHLSAWCKYYLNWGTTQIPNESLKNSRVYPSSSMDNNSSTNEFYKLNIPDTDGKEYFLVEYRRTTGGANKYDTALPAQGMLIWHVDENVITTSNLENDNINTDYTHRGIDLKPADKIEDLYTENKDPFGLDYQKFAMPESNGYNGKINGINILNISGVGNNFMTMDYVFVGSTTNQDISKLYTYPNPVVGNNPTKIIINCSKHPDNGKLKIFNIAGELVYEKSVTDNDLFFNDLSDYNWVYTCNWDCKNMYGQNVASGVYIYLFTSDSSKKSGKLVIIK
jgi:immune inhibitor A